MQILVALTMPHRSRFSFSAQDMVVYHFYQMDDPWADPKTLQRNWVGSETLHSSETKTCLSQKQAPNSGDIGRAISRADKAHHCFRWFWLQHWIWKRLRWGALMGKSSTHIHLVSNISLNSCDFCAKTCQSPPADHRAHTEPSHCLGLCPLQQPTGGWEVSGWVVEHFVIQWYI